MKTEFYRHIELDAELEEIKSVLESNDIPYEVTSTETLIDETFVGSGLFSKYTLKLFPSDFQHANEVLKAYFESKPIRLEDFEHFNEMSDEELFDIIENPHEWSGEAEVVARKILQKRNVAIEEGRIEAIKKKKTAELRKGKPVPTRALVLCFGAILTGYFFTIFFIAGLGMGYYYSYGQATDREGNAYFIYDEQARKAGKFVLYGGIVGKLILIILSVIYLA